MKRALLRLYPREFQALFAEEIVRRHDASGLLLGAAVEWAAKFRCALSASNGSLSDYPLYHAHQMRPPGDSGLDRHPFHSGQQERDP